MESLAPFEPFETRRLDESLWDLLQHDHYTPKQLARMVGIEPVLVCEAVFHGQLKATVINHHVVSIARADAIAWLREHV
jgi:hypothetical protein